MAGQLDRVPDLVLARLGGHAVELPLQLRHLARDADPAQREVAQLRQPLHSRSCSAWLEGVSVTTSLSLREHGEKPADEGALGPRDDRVDVAEPGVRLGQAEVVELLAGRLLDDLGPGEREQGARLRDRDVAEAGEAGEDAGVVGWVITERGTSAASRSSSTAHTVFGSCMSERIPPASARPPEAVTQTSGTPRRSARRRARTSRRRCSPSSRP